MNPDDSRPDRPPPDWLAGYADGELDASARRAVDDWLQHDPAARTELGVQQALSPGNEAFWQAAATPLPDEATWGSLRNQIEKRLREPVAAATPARQPPPRSWWLAGALALMTTAAAILVTLVSLNRPDSNPTPVAPRDEEQDDLDPVFHVASADDIDIRSMPEAAMALLVVGNHPLGTEIVQLAAFEDVDIRGIGPNAQGDFPELHMTPHGVARPMVWPATTEER